MITHIHQVSLPRAPFDSMLCPRRWSEDQVNMKLREKMTESFAEIWAIKQDPQFAHLSLRTCAFVLALQRVVRALVNRGFD